jgi:hypothetical protein
VVVSHIRQWLKAGPFAGSAKVTLPMHYQANTLVVNW